MRGQLQGEGLSHYRDALQFLAVLVVRSQRQLRVGVVRPSKVNANDFAPVFAWMIRRKPGDAASEISRREVVGRYRLIAASVSLTAVASAA